jgi:hypothetical protein
MAEARGCTSSSDITTLFKSKNKILKGLQPQWRVSATLFSMHVGKQGDDLFRARVIACLPRAGNPYTLEQSTTKLTNIIASKIFEFVTIGLQKVTRDILGWIEMLRQKRQPTFPSEFSTFITDAKQAMGFFCTYSTAASAGDPAPIPLYGLQAATKFYIEVQTAITAGDLAGKEDSLTQLLSFHWLFEPAIRLEITGWHEAELLKAKTTSGPSSSKKAKKATTEELARAKMALLFANT